MTNIYYYEHAVGKFLPTRTGAAWWVMGRSPYGETIRKACAPEVGALIG
jgi:hypothetical protein